MIPDQVCQRSQCSTLDTAQVLGREKLPELDPLNQVSELRWLCDIRILRSLF